MAENPKVKEKLLRDYCASSHYIMTILLKGYNFASSWDKITFQKQVSDIVAYKTVQTLFQIFENIYYN